jgi:two-component system cell cycle sensor histidine kinase/response regulator CckA
MSSGLYRQHIFNERGEMKMPITVLIVDDEEIVRKLIRVALKGSRDVVFLEAKDGAEALKVAREHREPIHLLISDVVMPGRMNGTEMAAQLSQSHSDMKVVMMSAYTPESITMKPDWHFIQKPFGTPEIRERIGSVLDRQSVAA